MTGASIYDTLTFNIAGATAQTITNIILNCQIDGSVSSLLFSGFENAALSYPISLGSKTTEASNAS